MTPPSSFCRVALLLVTLILLIGVVAADLPIPAFKSNVTSGNIPFSVLFNSTTGDAPLMTNWSFGDGSWDNETVLALQNVTHTYSAIGSYTVALQITNASGTNTTTKSGYIAANPQPPIVSFITNSTGGVARLPVLFNDTSTNTPISWQWGYKNITGNNTWTNGPAIQNITIIFGPGNWQINLTATNAGGSNTSAQVTFVNVTLPVSQFTPSGPVIGIAPYTIFLTDNSTGSPSQCLWYWGDGTVTSGCGARVMHEYQLLGIYPITLSVTASGFISNNQTTAFIL